MSTATYSPTFLKIKKVLDMEASLFFLIALFLILASESMALASAAIPLFAANGAGTWMATFSSVTIFGTFGLIQFLLGYKVFSILANGLEDGKLDPREIFMAALFTFGYYVFWKGAFHINLVLEGVIPMQDMIDKILPEVLIGSYNIVSPKDVKGVIDPTYNNIRAMALNIIILYAVPSLEFFVALFAIVEGHKKYLENKAASSSPTSSPTPSPSPAPSPSPSPSSSPAPASPSTPPPTVTPTPTVSSAPPPPPSNPVPTVGNGGLGTALNSLSQNAGRFLNPGNLLGGRKNP